MKRLGIAVRVGRLSLVCPDKYLKIPGCKIKIMCYHIYNTCRHRQANGEIQKNSGGDGRMVIEIDFNSEEAIYMQVTNQIIMGIATSRLQEGDALPSVRQLAEMIGINMHTVNKAYSLLRQEGFVTIDRRRGAVISVDVNKIKALEEMKQNLMVALARGCCKKCDQRRSAPVD